MWILALALLAMTGSAGCLVHGHAYATTAPPPPRYVEVEYRPGYVWVDGRWVWGAGGWYWQDGYWVGERHGYYWVNGYYDTRGGRYVWVDGYWSPGKSRPRGVWVRDHRGSSRGGGSPWVRDHRDKGRSGGKSGGASPWVRDHRSTTPGPSGVRTRDHRTEQPRKPPPADTRPSPWKKGETSKPKDDKSNVRVRDHRKK